MKLLGRKERTLAHLATFASSAVLALGVATTAAASQQPQNEQARAQEERQEEQALQQRQQQQPPAQEDQAQADVTVRQQEPRVQVEDEPPRIIVEDPDPDVSVTQPEPQVEVEPVQPEVQVEQAEPQVQVEEGGDPQVTVREAPEDTAQAQPQPPQDQQLQQLQQHIGGPLLDSQGQEIGQVDEIVRDTNDQSLHVVVSAGQDQAALPADQVEASPEGLRLSPQMTVDDLAQMPYQPDQYEPVQAG